MNVSETGYILLDVLDVHGWDIGYNIEKVANAVLALLACQPNFGEIFRDS